eukprot:gene4337-4761_t
MILSILLLGLLSVLALSYELLINDDHHHRDLKINNKKVPVIIDEKAADVISVERSMMEHEVLRADHVLHNLRTSHGYEAIQGFYHTSNVRQYWKDVLAEQLYLLDGRRPIPEKNFPRYSKDIPWDNTRLYTSLLNISTGLYLNIVATENQHKEEVENYVKSLNLKHADKIMFNFNRTIPRYLYDQAKGEKRQAYDNDHQLSCGEYPTIMKLRDYCIDQVKAGKKTLVYYIHAKGGCCQRNVTDAGRTNDGVVAWREYMDAAIIEFPSICLRAISRGYLTCGVENQNMHYSGNFWWADCGHVAQLRPLTNRWDFGAPEFFLLRFRDDFPLDKTLGFQCGYSVFNCGVNLYDVACSRDRYRDRLSKFVHYKLGPNNVRGKNDNLAFCRELIKEYKPYTEREKELDTWYRGGRN